MNMAKDCGTNEQVKQPFRIKYSIPDVDNPFHLSSGRDFLFDFTNHFSTDQKIWKEHVAMLRKMNDESSNAERAMPLQLWAQLSLKAASEIQKIQASNSDQNSPLVFIYKIYISKNGFIHNILDTISKRYESIRKLSQVENTWYMDHFIYGWYRRAVPTGKMERFSSMEHVELISKMSRRLHKQIARFEADPEKLPFNKKVSNFLFRMTEYLSQMKRLISNPKEIEKLDFWTYSFYHNFPQKFFDLNFKEEFARARKIEENMLSLKNPFHRSLGTDILFGFENYFFDDNWDILNGKIALLKKMNSDTKTLNPLQLLSLLTIKAASRVHQMEKSGDGTLTDLFKNFIAKNCHIHSILDQISEFYFQLRGNPQVERTWYNHDSVSSGWFLRYPPNSALDKSIGSIELEELIPIMRQRLQEQIRVFRTERECMVFSKKVSSFLFNISEYLAQMEKFIQDPKQFEKIDHHSYDCGHRFSFKYFYRNFEDDSPMPRSTKSSERDESLSIGEEEILPPAPKKITLRGPKETTLRAPKETTLREPKEITLCEPKETTLSEPKEITLSEPKEIPLCEPTQTPLSEPTKYKWFTPQTHQMLSKIQEIMNSNKNHLSDPKSRKRKFDDA